MGGLSQKKVFKDIFKVIISNMFTIVSGIVVGFVLPKIIGIENYGYYKTFTLYITYVGLFHFGIEDGIYLKYGGKNLEELDVSSFRFYTKFLFLIEFAISLVVLSISVCFLSAETRFIFIFAGLFLLFGNLSQYFQYISQITSRFNELSIINIIRNILIILIIIGMLIVYRIKGNYLNYRIYTVFYVFTYLASLIAYIIIYRRFVFGKSGKFKDNKHELLEFVKCGFPLFIANFCSGLILTVDRQFVNILFDNSIYATYAFAYNLLTLITTVVSAFSTVLYPFLKKSNEDSLRSNYTKLVSVILIFVFACLFVYFPLNAFISWYLPQYTNSLLFFRILLPGLALSSVITIVMHNYFKVLGKNFRFFIYSLIVLALSVIADIVMYFVFGTTVSLSIISIAVMLIWYGLTEFYFIRKYKIRNIKNNIYMVLQILIFYAVTCINILWLAAIIYLVCFMITLFCFYFKEIKLLILNIKRKNSDKAKENSAE